MAWHSTSSSSRGYGTQWRKLREHVLARDRGLCVACYRRGILAKATDVDHIVPKFRGGTDAMSNLQSLCRDCHKEKTAIDGGAKERARIRADGFPEGSEWVL